MRQGGEKRDIIVLSSDEEAEVGKSTNVGTSPKRARNAAATGSAVDAFCSTPCSTTQRLAGHVPPDSGTDTGPVPPLPPVTDLGAENESLRAQLKAADASVKDLKSKLAKMEERARTAERLHRRDMKEISERRQAKIMDRSKDLAREAQAMLQKMKKEKEEKEAKDKMKMRAEEAEERAVMAEWANQEAEKGRDEAERTRKGFEERAGAYKVVLKEHGLLAEEVEPAVGSA
ncbi:hypothetical protein A1Q1_00592 [Trichosporon asahii var. asahii CBS 2479]|uniref:Uncharacterized protein n=1 Tax=Trichosporon asahii var. asahii (strain ATCC 90039 / CBS 2479 / JCM 2466 / KCTC 7840 / NBRC 103889/ NCYC 2677 / UAMH 7654) TaxID=1186058 RepID=J4UFH8_TRIAS|nr:hypothetical protein A1Q1_00592 [Trichosporon asahii var. asahii CBS 2479]EJT50125.1 hypothetical protein A1Q1_00592 [Trichosporon asahii var. asahii CBS 2479]